MVAIFTPTAPLVVYQSDIVLAFNQRKKKLYPTVTTTFQPRGSSAVFEVGDAGHGFAVQRAANSFIPSGNITQSQYTVPLTAEFAKYTRTKEDIAGSQGDIIRLMTDAAVGKMNRTIDQNIRTTLATGSVGYYSASPITSVASQIFSNLFAILSQNFVDNDGDIYCAITPAVAGALQELPAFANSLYANKTPLATGEMNWHTEGFDFIWNGIKFIIDPQLPGVGTTSETNFMWHKKSVGMACDYGQESMGGNSGAAVDAGWNGENKFYYINADFRIGSTVIQDSGIIKFYSNGTALLNLPS